MTLLYDFLKVFFPFGWGIFCIAAVIGYLAIPDTPRWIAASAWFVSMIISCGFVVHIWNYHRSTKPVNYRVLPEENQRNVSIKLIIAVVVCIVTFIISIIFWLSKKPEQYADAFAYTGSWIISAIWLCDLWKYHRDSNPTIKFDKEDEVNTSNDIENDNAMNMEDNKIENINTQPKENQEQFDTITTESLR